MSEQDEELELRALQRELDDAFTTARPRAGYDDEVWLRMQAARPAQSRFRDAFAGFFHGILAVPKVPAAAVATVLVLALGLGLLFNSGFVHGPGAASTASRGEKFTESGMSLRDGATFGKLPTPVFNPVVAHSGPLAAQPSNDYNAPPQTPYFGPATLTWTGQMNVNFSRAPVFRYHEPAPNKADEFATSLGAAPNGKPAGYLGSYSAQTYSLLVRGTMKTPAESPTYVLTTNRLMPDVLAAGASPADLANVFLAEHSLSPQWPTTVVPLGSGDQVRVLFVRQFEASGYGLANLIDGSGDPYGLSVDLNGNRVVRAQGPLPLKLDTATYPVISGDQAIKMALVPSANQQSPSTPGPAVQLTKADLVYVLAPAGDHSFYVPAYLFSGAFQMNSATYVMRVLVPAIDPSQRS
jgi:hypothetical protein